MLLTPSVLYAPVWLLALGASQGLAIAAFAGQWTFNPLVFKSVAAALGVAAARFTCIGLFALAWLILARQWMARLRGASRKNVNQTTTAMPPLLLLPTLVGVFTAMPLLSLVVNPWYWLWVLPVAMLPFSSVAWVAGNASLLAYSHVLTQVTAGSFVATYAVPLWASGLQSALVIAAFGFAYNRRKRIERSCHKNPHTQKLALITSTYG